MSNKLPAFTVLFDDGAVLHTSMAAGTTLEQARDYYVGQGFVLSDEKTWHYGLAVAPCQEH